MYLKFLFQLQVSRQMQNKLWNFRVECSATIPLHLWATIPRVKTVSKRQEIGRIRATAKNLH